MTPTDTTTAIAQVIHTYWPHATLLLGLTFRQQLVAYFKSWTTVGDVTKQLSDHETRLKKLEQLFGAKQNEVKS